MSSAVSNGDTQCSPVVFKVATNSNNLGESTTYEKSAEGFAFHTGKTSSSERITNMYTGIPFALAVRNSRFVIDLPWSVVEPYLVPTIRTRISALSSTALRQLSRVPASGLIGKLPYSDRTAN